MKSFINKIIKTIKIKGLNEFLKIANNYLKLLFKFKFGYYISSTAQLRARRLIRISKRVEIQDYVIIKTFQNPVIIGEYTQINPFTVIYGGSGVIIGKNVMIAPHCMIASGNHNHKQLEKSMRHGGDFSNGPIVIEDGVWIGANSTITDGVTIGHNAVVSANSVITKNVSPFDIVGGVPAKVISNRIDASLNRKLSYEERLVYINNYKNKYLI